MAGRMQPLDPARTPIDNAYYDAVGDAWWDERGPFSALHEMNPVRIGYFDRAMTGRLGVAERRDVCVLDVGCGGGLVSEGLSRLGYRVRGVDLNPGAVAAASRHAVGAGLTVHYTVGSAYQLPERDGAMDAVVASDVFEHLHDLDAAIAEIARVLRPGGVLAFDTINRTGRSYLVMILLAEWLLRVNHRGTHNWRLFIRPAELASVLERHGLSLVEYTGLAPARAVPAAIAGYLRSRRLSGYKLTSDDSASYIGYAVKTRHPEEQS
ncbi:MAG TPA: bifunctional 2-polyprenyl-6-hydroxyphenol methylase/3-demethylubiquinol 3-O-methyltransferase UbiG [Micromonosporaceae bacterium]|nr:bifunctional 2-polyprenyl-6-hydroxyphenol methylase/3-demethylubiquinol 3-O-methyltransferase UbiG [Micromonosporaceae bacterium]